MSRATTFRRHFAALALGLVALIGAQCGRAYADKARSGGDPREEVSRHVRQASEIGRALFSDTSLSGSGRQSCASCHRPDHAFGPADMAPVELGGTGLQRSGLRAVPSLMYGQASPPFTEHYFESEDEADESVDNGPTGGLTWDGRVDRGRDQARIPLLSPLEMANPSPSAVVDRVRQGVHADAVRAVFGGKIFDDETRAFAAILEALEVFQQDYRLFYPYRSKYDDVLAGRATLTAQEARGLAAFNDPARGNCAHCHISKRSRDGSPPQFTDYGLIALGVPRNPQIPANRDPTFYDLGLCGPERNDFADHPEYCGLFKTPTLRNVAVRNSFFHNGVFHRLRDAVAFYARRDTNPEAWYSRAPDGQVLKFDDLPPRYRGNVNVERPFGGMRGDRPALSDEAIDDIVIFLQTLTDKIPPDR